MAAIIDYIPLVISLFAICVSLLSYTVSRRSLINSTITKHRIDWINNIRALSEEFIVHYIENDVKGKRIVQGKILLYLRYDVAIYADFINTLDSCVNNDYDHDTYKLLIISIQSVLSDVWNRMKREAGISLRNEKKIKNLLKKEKSDSK